MPTLAGASVMAASLVNFLNHNEYPLLRPEVGLVLGLLLAVVVLAGLAYAGGGRISRTVLQVVLVYLALDLNFDGLVVPIATIGIAIFLNRHMIPFIGIASSFVLLTGLAGLAVSGSRAEEAPRSAAAEPAAERPVLLHIILDEHIGIEGLPDDTPGAEMRERLKAFYLDRGFRLFGGAYSEYFRTVNSVPQMLNFGEQQPWNPSNRIRTVMSSNAYFDRLGRDGYRIHVLQTDYLDYCDNAFVVECRTRRAAELAVVADAPLPAGEKAYIIAIEFAKLSPILSAPAIFYQWTSYPARIYEIPPLGPLATFDELARELRAATPGSAYFVHELLPHTPYMLQGDCSLRDPSVWKNRSYGPKTERQAAYFEQITCLNRKLEQVLDAAGPDAIVVLHGDHGSRITDVDTQAEALGAFDDADLIAGYSTLFAVRAPGISPGYDRHALPAAGILRELALSRFRSPPKSMAPGFVPSVFLEDRDTKPVMRHPLPSGWPGPAAPGES